MAFQTVSATQKRSTNVGQITTAVISDTKIGSYLNGQIKATGAAGVVL